MWLFGLDLDFGNLDKIQNSTSNAHFTVGVRPFIYLFIHVELLNDVIGFCVVFLITKQKCFFLLFTLIVNASKCTREELNRQ